MRDPHVVSLKYTLLVPAGLVYKDVPAMNVSHAQFRGELHEGYLNVKMDAHFPTITDARQAVETFLKAWEIDAHLKGKKIKFSFEDSELIDRNPVQGGSVVLASATCVISSSFTVSGTITVHPREYPPPPCWTTVSNLAQRMYDRFVAYQEKQESIFTSGYYCLTELQVAAGTTVTRKARASAASRFKIDIEVLDTLGELTSERGGALFARKAGTPEPTSNEAAWLSSAVPVIIGHIASVEADADVSVLTMADLPEL
jgi:hypothetical protein